MINLYVKYKIADYRGEDTTNIQEEIHTTFQKIYTQYKDKDIFNKIEHYKNFGCVPSFYVNKFFFNFLDCWVSQI
jgi:glutaredoxin-related protein